MNAIVRALALVSRRVPVVVIVVMVVATAGFGALSSQAEQDQSQEAFSPDNPRLSAAEFAGEAFSGGATETVVQVIVEGDDVVSPDGLATVQAVTDAVLAEVPPERLGGQGGPVVGYLAPLQLAVQSGELDPATLADDAAFDAAYEQAVQQAPPEVGQLAGGLVAGGDAATDADIGLLIVTLDTAAVVGDAPDDTVALERQVAAVRQVADLVEDLDTPLATSATAFELFFEDDGTFTSEIGRLFGTAALIIVVILFLVYLFPPRGQTRRRLTVRRALADVGLTLFAILASITWMQGIGVLLGPDYLGLIGALSPPTQIIPILLIGLGVDYAIHLTSRYREELSEGATVEDAADRAIGSVGVALVLATMTTALGFLTNITNPVPAIQDFGILAAVGITAAFLLTLTFVPAVRILLDRRAARYDRLPRHALAGSSEGRLSALAAGTSVLAERFAVPVLTVTVALGALGGYGLTQLSTEFSFTDFVPEGNPAREAFLTLQDRFAGGFGEQTPVVMQGEVATARVHNATVAGQQALGDVDGVISFGEQAAAESVVTAMARQLQLASADGTQEAQGQPDGPPGATPPTAEQVDAAGRFAEVATTNGLGQDLTVADDADVAAIYDALLAADPQAGGVLARDGDAYVGSQVVVQTQSETVGALVLADDLEAAFDVGDDVAVVATGNAVITQAIIGDLSSSQVTSLLATLAAALVLLMVVFGVREGSPVLGALTLAPVGLVVLWVFGTMAATGIPFGPVTSTISGLAIGIGVPFTIHITHRFTEDLDELGDLDAALRSTTRHTGGALLGSALTTMAGFVVLVTSSLVPFRQLGLVVAYAIGFSLIAALLVLPSMLALWARRRAADMVAG